MKKIKTRSTASLLLLFFATTIFLIGCQKGIKKQEPAFTMTKPERKVNLPAKTNPFSLRNVQKAKATIAAKKTEILSGSPAAKGGAGIEEQFVYFKFNPMELTQQDFLALENDTTVKLMEIPFADFNLYTEDLALDEQKAELLKDGNIYGVTSIKNVAITSRLSSNSRLQTRYLDTLVQIAEEDTTLQFQALREIGYTEDQLGKFRICLFKRPHGFVRYQDNQLNRLEPVRGMQVWALFLGIPIHTYTDANGYYEIPWRFSIGTIMGTHAKNPRVNIKPLDTHGTLIRNIYTLITQFVVGSLHIYGWVTPCQMKDGKDFNFTGHTQVRYWSQLLNAYFFHDQYAAQDRIDNAPWGMVCYAQWANTGEHVDINGNPDFGSASTMLLGHISLQAALVEYFLDGLFDWQVNLSTDFPNLFQLLTGLLPDMTFRVPQAAEPAFYNARLAQVAHHELGHASHFRRVGNAWWIELGRAELANHAIPGNPYGDGFYENAGYVAVAESWAEFIGFNHVLRRYPANTAIDEATNTIGFIQRFQFYRMTNLIENQFYFHRFDWIPMGLYHDFMDNTNIAPNNPGEGFDRIQGVTIAQLFRPMGPEVRDMCGYYNSFLQVNPGLNVGDVFDIFNAHNAICR